MNLIFDLSAVLIGKRVIMRIYGRRAFGQKPGNPVNETEEMDAGYKVICCQLILSENSFCLLVAETFPIKTRSADRFYTYTHPGPTVRPYEEDTDRLPDHTAKHNESLYTVYNTC